MTQPDPKSIPCGRSTCRAQIGEQCVTATGNRATYPHAARTAPLWRAWVDGFEDGLRDAIADPKYAARWVAANPEGTAA